jgi:predicted dehydrogenase
MGAAHARVMAGLDAFRLAAVCDLDEGRARDVAGQFPGAKAYADYAQMLRSERPEVVAVVTPSDSHADLTAMAAEAGARGICCEKPMATCMADGRRMVAACRERGVPLIVNHQRRMSGPLVHMRRLVAAGVVGDVCLIRASCAGDVLSDGTHAVDSVRWFAGDEEVSWVLGQVYRVAPDPQEPKGVGYTTSGGYRYGHPVETGAVAVLEFRSRLRAEVLCGGAQLPGRQYQDYEVFGTQGRLWRQGDRSSPPVLMQDQRGGGWREAPLDAALATVEPMAESYRRLAQMIHGEAEEAHPLSGDSALKDLEVVMAIYESARTNSRVELPLRQDRFPLQLMMEEGRL